MIIHINTSKQLDIIIWGTEVIDGTYQNSFFDESLQN